MKEGHNLSSNLLDRRLGMVHIPAKLRVLSEQELAVVKICEDAGLAETFRRVAGGTEHFRRLPPRDWRKTLVSFLRTLEQRSLDQNFRNYLKEVPYGCEISFWHSTLGVDAITVDGKIRWIVPSSPLKSLRRIPDLGPALKQGLLPSPSRLSLLEIKQSLS